jgi:hypothetical protein
VTPFRIAPSKAYFGYFRYVQVPSDPHRLRYFWDENGHGPVFVQDSNRKALLVVAEEEGTGEVVYLIFA